MAEEWENLVKILEINGCVEDVLTEDLCQYWENKINFILPQGYKEFCQILGSGQFGESYRIYCSNLDQLQEMREAVRLLLHTNANFFEHSRQIGGEWSEEDIAFFTPENLGSLENLLNCAFVFGDNSASDVLFWDLRTYSESDKSYDIYLAVTTWPRFYKVGRNFFEFIKDFCLGMKSYEILPEGISPNKSEIFNSFTSFPKREVSGEELTL